MSATNKILNWILACDELKHEIIVSFIDTLLKYTGANTEKDNSFFITICYRCFWITLGEPDRYRVFCDNCHKNDKTIVRYVHGKYEGSQ